MFTLQRIPTLGSRLNVSARSHRAGMWPGTMGQDDDSTDDLSSSNVSATIVPSNPTTDNSAGVGITGLTDGVSSVLANISPAAQVGILNSITNALGITKPKTIIVGSPAPSSTLPSWLLPAAAAGVVLLIIMNHKKG